MADCDSLICSLCSQLYDDPRVLSCLHSFCRECLVKRVDDAALYSSLSVVDYECVDLRPIDLVGPPMIIDTSHTTINVPIPEIRCPEDFCQKITNGPVAELPKNLYLEQRVSSYLQIQGIFSDSPRCDLCDDDTMPVWGESVVFCLNCSKSVCNECRKYHI